MTDRSDDALIEALRRGDRTAVGSLFDRHYDELFAFADRFLGDPHAAADAVQDAFVSLLRYGRSFQGRSSIRTWLMAVLRNACLDLAEERKRHSRASERLPPAEHAAPPDLPDPRLPRLRRAIEALPESRREVLVLRRFHDLTYAEIADLCGITEGTARVRAHRALRQLERELSPSPEHRHD